jgi:hypothetical protein
MVQKSRHRSGEGVGFVLFRKPRRASRWERESISARFRNQGEWFREPVDFGVFQKSTSALRPRHFGCPHAVGPLYHPTRPGTQTQAHSGRWGRFLNYPRKRVRVSESAASFPVTVAGKNVERGGRRDAPPPGDPNGVRDASSIATHREKGRSAQRQVEARGAPEGGPGPRVPRAARRGARAARAARSAT